MIIVYLTDLIRFNSLMLLQYIVNGYAITYFKLNYWKNIEGH